MVINLDLGEQATGSESALHKQVEEAFLDARDDVYYYVLTLGLRPAEAQEVTQEVFLRLYTTLRSGTEIENTRAWVFRVAHNLGSNVRGKHRYVSIEDQNGIVDTAASADNPEKRAIQDQTMAHVREAIANLSPQQRRCVHLRAEGLRYHEIAAVLGVSASTVNELLRRAVQRIRKVVHA